jgi:hypothetical protein
LERGYPLVAGDIVVWQVPDSQFDEPDGAAGESDRPRWLVAGAQQVRTVILDRAGRVMVDRTGDEYALDTPVGAHRIALLGAGRVQADKGGATAGLGGWQETTTLAAVAAGTYLGPHCVVTTDGGRRPVRRSAEARSSATLLPAGAAVAGAEMIATRLPAGTTSVAVILDGVNEARCGDALARDLLLRVDGAEPDGRPPVVLATENRLIAVYGVRPRRGGDAVTVHLATPTQWRVAGVVGGRLDPDALANQLETTDVSSLVAPLVASPTGISKAGWGAPGGPEPDMRLIEEAATDA